MTNDLRTEGATMEMHARRERMPDGRYMIYYQFTKKPEVGEASVPAPEVQPRSKEKKR